MTQQGETVGNAFGDRELSDAEAREYLAAPITDAEREDVLALVSWFTRRYPTPLDRLAYIRRAYARWRRTNPIPSRTEIAGRRD